MFVSQTVMSGGGYFLLITHGVRYSIVLPLNANAGTDFMRRRPRLETRVVLFPVVLLLDRVLICLPPPTGGPKNLLDR